MKKFIKKLVPQKIVLLSKKVKRKFLLLLYHGKKYVCPVCNKSFRRLLDAGMDAEFFRRIKILGGGIRKNANCPNCYSFERTRLEFLYLKDHTKIFEESCSILHFAPEKSITDVLKNNKNINYISCDIDPTKAMRKEDITNISFSDESFDYIICNHVLEHIPNEQKALSELRRVLKAGGELIITVPLCIDNKNTYENNLITSDEERLMNYGQRDHVRLYGLDFVQRLSDSYFDAKGFKTCENFTKEDVLKYALIPEETVFIAKKISIR